MMAYWLDKRWAQNAVLLALAGLMVWYWGFVFEFGYDFEWSVLYTFNETYGMHLGLELLKGLGLTIKITLASSFFALLLGTFFGLGRLSKFKPLRWTSNAYVEFFRNTPLLVQLFFWYFAMPMALPDAAREFLFAHNYEFWTATIGLSIYTGSFMAEVIRAGLQSIPKGLLEAAYSSGLSYFQVLTRIILPLAFRAIIPPLGSEFLNNMKNSSLAMVVGVAELCWQSQQVESLTFRGFEATTAATILYLSLSLIISLVLNTVNVRLRSLERRPRNRVLRTLHILFSPLGRLRRASRQSTPVPTQASLRLSPGAAFMRRLGRILVGLGIPAAKIGFVASIGYLLFRVAQGVASFNWQVIADNIRTLLIWRFPEGSENELFWGLGGLSFSILMSFIAISVSFFIGLIAGLARTSRNRIFSLPATLYIECVRGTPLIMVIFWIYFFLPAFTGSYLNVFWSATIALTVFTGAYLAEIVRGGIQNIPPGQVEAAYSTGLSYSQTMRKIVLPQALKQMIPAIVGQFIAIFKDTSLAYVIGVLELTFVAQGINNRLMVYPFEIYTTVAVLYFLCCYSMSIVAGRLERRLSPDQVRLEM
ncbi:MAG: amino acid ABC transporter permease [Desulfocurvibacter africanus]